MERDYLTGEELTFRPIIKRSDGFAQVQAERGRPKPSTSRLRLTPAERQMRRWCLCKKPLTYYQDKYCSMKCARRYRLYKRRMNVEISTRVPLVAVVQALHAEGVPSIRIGELVGWKRKEVRAATVSERYRGIPWELRRYQQAAIEAAQTLMNRGV